MFPGFVAQNHPNQQKKRGADDAIDDRETPSNIYNPLNAEFGFTIDVAASRGNAKCKRYYARAPWTEVDALQVSLFAREYVGDPDALGYNGLEQPWGAAEVVWCNPPFSDLKAWIAKAHAAECTVVMVLPANRSEQSSWQRYIEPYRDGNADLPEWREYIDNELGGDRPRGVVRTRFLDKRRSFLVNDEVVGNKTSKNPPFGVVVVIWDRRPRRRRRGTR